MVTTRRKRVPCTNLRYHCDNASTRLVGLTEQPVNRHCSSVMVAANEASVTVPKSDAIPPLVLAVSAAGRRLIRRYGRTV